MAKAPSYRACSPSSQRASRTLRHVRSRDTTPEVLLRRELWSRGLRYRLHARHLPGRPDLIFPGAKVAVFCDGDFWHGRDWAARRKKLSSGANANYWLAKIATNMSRDRARTNELLALGWKVVRFWETDILSDVKTCAHRVEGLVRGAQGKSS